MLWPLGLCFSQHKSDFASLLEIQGGLCSECQCHFSAGCSDTCLASFSKFTLPSPLCHCSGAGFRFTLVCVTLSRFTGVVLKSIIYVLLELVQTPLISL